MHTLTLHSVHVHISIVVIVDCARAGSSGAAAAADGWSVLLSHLIGANNLSWDDTEKTCCFNVSEVEKSLMSKPGLFL